MVRRHCILVPNCVSIAANDGASVINGAKDVRLEESRILVTDVAVRKGKVNYII